MLSCRPLGFTHTTDLLSRLLASLGQSLRADAHSRPPPPGGSGPQWELTVATGYLNPPDWLLERLSSLLPANTSTTTTSTRRAHTTSSASGTSSPSGVAAELSGRGRPVDGDSGGYETARVRVVAASPRTNGWHGAQGFSSLVTAFYNRLQLRLEARLRGALYEWDSETCSFHAKGIWLLLPPPPRAPLSPSASSSRSPAGANSATSSSSGGPPSMFVVGSSNYGERSTRRDFEFDLLLVSREPRVCKLFARELGTLLPAGGDSPLGNKSRPAPFSARIVPIHRSLIEQRIRNEPLWKRVVLRVLTSFARSFL